MLQEFLPAMPQQLGIADGAVRRQQQQEESQAGSSSHHPNETAQVTLLARRDYQYVGWGRDVGSLPGPQMRNVKYQM